MRKSSLLIEGLGIASGYSVYKFLKACFSTIKTSNPILRVGFTLVEVAYGITASVTVTDTLYNVTDRAEKKLSLVSNICKANKTDVVHFADEEDECNSNIYENAEYKKSGGISREEYLDPIFEGFHRHILYFYKDTRVAISEDGSSAVIDDYCFHHFIFDILPDICPKKDTSVTLAYFRDWNSKCQYEIIVFPSLHKEGIQND